MSIEELSPEEKGAFLAKQQKEESPFPFPTLGAETGPGLPDEGNLRLLMDVVLEVTAELGRTRRPIREIISLGPGSVVELDRVAGEAVDILINGRPVAKGEVVIVGDHYGVRLTQINDPAAWMAVKEP